MKNSWQVTVALAYIAQAFREEPQAFEVFQNMGFGAIRRTEPLIYRLSEAFAPDKKAELRERFYRTFYPEWANEIIDLDVEVIPEKK